VATPAWRKDEVGFRNRTGSCNQSKQPRRAASETAEEEEGCLGPRDRRGEGGRGGVPVGPWERGCRAPWRGLRSCARHRRSSCSPRVASAPPLPWLGELRLSASSGWVEVADDQKAEANNCFSFTEGCVINGTSPRQLG
jgi:hypothetical protein